MSEWIPVSERLPELKEVFDPEGDDWRESIFVLVCTIDHNICIGQRWKINEQHGWAGLFGECFDVTHWMPLPTPPKEASNV